MPKLHGNEGVNGTGCWFFFARGSGIYVPVGRSLIARNEKLLLRQLNRRDGFVKGKANGSDAPAPNKERYPLQAQGLGYDSVQMGGVGKGSHAQLVLTSPPCMTQPKPIKACPPAGVHMRKGWGARSPCSCADGGEQTMNCGGV